MKTKNPARETTSSSPPHSGGDELRSEPPDFLRESVTLEQARKRYGISLPKLYDWFEEGLPSMKIGRRRLVHIPTADAWVKAKLTGTAT